MSEESVKVEKPMNLSDLQPVQSGSGVDLEKYHKKDVEIESAEIIQVASNYTENGKQWVLKVRSKVLETFEKDDGTKVEFRASELFNLMQDKEGKLLGYPDSPDSNLQKFMGDIKAESIDKIVGNKATIKAFPKEENGNKKIYLKFLY